MKTDELIVRLAASASPVTPLRPPAVRGAQWVAAAVAIIAVSVLAIGPRVDLLSAIGQPAFLVSLGVLLVTLGSAAAAAFVLSVPGAERSPAQHVLPVCIAGVWPAIWLTVTSGAVGPIDRPALFHWGCAIEIAGIAWATGAILFAMVWGAAPLRPAWTAALASLAGVAAGATATQIICPIDDPVHQLVGHVLTAAVVAVAGLFVGRRALSAWAWP